MFDKIKSSLKDGKVKNNLHKLLSLKILKFM